MALTVGTHSGTFHADDVLAFALLRVFVDADAVPVRTRDKDKLDACDVVIDVGGVGFAVAVPPTVAARLPAFGGADVNMARSIPDAIECAGPADTFVLMADDAT